MTREGDLHVAGSERMRSRSVIKVVFLSQSKKRDEGKGIISK